MRNLQESTSHNMYQSEEIRTHGVNSMTNDFIKIKCPDCGNEQIAFRKAATQVTCHVCNSVLITPKGGVGEIRGEILEVVG